MDITSLICVSLYVVMVAAAGSAQFPYAEPSVAAVWGLTVVMVASSVVLITVPVVRYFKRAQRELEAKLMVQLKETSKSVRAGRKDRRRYKRLQKEMENLEEMRQKVEEEMTRVEAEQKKIPQSYAEREIALKQWMEEELKHSVSVAVTKALREEHLDIEKRIQNSINDMYLKRKEEVREGSLNKIDCQKTELQKMSEQFSNLKSHVETLCEIFGHYNMLVRQTIRKMCGYNRQVRSLKDNLRQSIHFQTISGDGSFLFNGTRRRHIHERWLIEEAVGTPSGERVQQKERDALTQVREMITSMKKRNSDVRKMVVNLREEREHLSKIRIVAQNSLACTNNTGKEQQDQTSELPMIF
uniref:Uncharacterized protein n=1 Tax=Branchiostoma floridae TaxID=7739 RepID=C3YZK1_BRAFL|eukprot:XP_002598260.1 hypothetical protein BRAFLDRAFT_69592 [Branchiostoma floridae]